MFFGHNNRKWNQEAYYLGKDQIEITHEYKCLGIDFYSHDYFEPSSKKRRIASMKALMTTWRKEIIVEVTCWELKSHLFKALVLPIFTYGNHIWRGNFKDSHWKVFGTGMKIHMMSHVQVRSSTTYDICWQNLENSMKLYALRDNYRFLTTICPPTLFLVSQSSSLFSTSCQTRVWHLTQIDNHVEGIARSIHWETHENPSHSMIYSC